MTEILIIDDELPLQKSLSMFLGEKGYRVHTADSAAQGLEVASRVRPPVVILDIRLPDMSGLEALAPLKVALPEAKVIMITAYHDMETTIEAMRRGAYDYIHKPLDVDELEASVRRAAHDPDLNPGATARLTEQGDPADLDQLVGSSHVMRRLYKAIGRLTQSRATVLIEGETGTGKEVIARVIHGHSPFCREPFTTIDCTTLVGELMESELFGHEKGAFTGATRTKPGRLEMAGEGTIFFDEVGELPANLQAKLLRFLERREFTRLGGAKTYRSPARIIGATNRPLEQMAEQGSFRSDLLFRFKVATISAPPLRERLEDLEELVPHFLNRINSELQTDITQVERGAMNALRTHHWPGNVRELINVLTRAAINSQGQTILAGAVRESLEFSTGQRTYSRGILTLQEAEKEHILHALKMTGWNVSAAARALGVSRPTLRKRLVKHNLKRPID